MSQVNVIARFTIHDGGLEAFKEAAAECRRIVAEKEQENTFQYDWFLNPEQTECTVVERYRDSDAVMGHVSNVGETLGALAAVSDLELVVCGELSDELSEAAAGLSARTYLPL